MPAGSEHDHLRNRQRLLGIVEEQKRAVSGGADEVAVPDPPRNNPVDGPKQVSHGGLSQLEPVHRPSRLPLDLI
jgi:hypothetical protein